MKQAQAHADSLLALTSDDRPEYAVAVKLEPLPANVTPVRVLLCATYRKKKKRRAKRVAQENLQKY
jgi:hypothetical protein